MVHTVVIADDHELVRRGVNNVLAVVPDIQIVGEASNGIEALAQAKKHTPDLVILDLSMAYANGIEVVEELKRWCPDTRAIILTGMTSQGLLLDAWKAGVAGLFLKSEETSLLSDAVPEVLAGKRVASPKVAALLKDAEGIAKQLSGRERQVLHGLASGFSPQEIAGRLGISIHTVDKHRSNIMRKLDVHSMGQLMAVAIREGLLEPMTQR
ncbi:response regulator [Parvularcula maris]|uniref:Response regulator transcription factor n=1 Tax=Parvularcula maris TaxID=2965077 RepID=A0A9X2LAZ2_9PROT|nr:response regulator transcription factor [Parvularcula maris]MCQ8186342.1 response regulator transcription factor [Parvularcula maris]